jgi:uncharacterized protein with HEPN domain
MSRDEGVVLDILNAAGLIREFIAGQDLTDFLSDSKTCFAVLHQLVVIGEAAKRLSAEYRANHPEIPWREMAGLRDVLVHHYDEIDLLEIWETVTGDLPGAVAAISRLVPPRDL